MYNDTKNSTIISSCGYCESYIKNDNPYSRYTIFRPATSEPENVKKVAVKVKRELV